MIGIEPLLILIVGTYITYACSRLLYRLKKPHLTGIIATIFFTIALASMFLLAQEVLPSGQQLEFSLFGTTDFRITMRIDALGIFLATIVISLGLIVSIYSTRYMERDTRLDKYYPLLILLVTGIVGVAFAGDIFNLYVFFELMCISSYILVAFRREKWEPIEAGFKYLIMSTVGSSLALLAIAIIFAQTGTLDLLVLGEKISLISEHTPFIAAICLLIIGFGVKAAIVPLHTWLPDAHAAAPSGISAMLSGIVIETGFFAMLRVLLVFHGTDISFGLALAVFAVITMTVGNLMALVQRDLKRMLAYSSVTQMGYILLGVGLGFEYFVKSGFEGGLFHIMTHAFMKGLAFLCAGSILYRIGTRDITKMRGIARTMPLTCLSFAIAGLALAGVPPFSGFMSKWLVYKAGVDAMSLTSNWALVFTVIAVLNSVLSLGYYLPIINTFFFSETCEEASKAREAPVSMLFAMFLMVAITILLGVLPGLGLRVVEPAAEYLSSLFHGGL